MYGWEADYEAQQLSIDARSLVSQGGGCEQVAGGRAVRDSSTDMSVWQRAVILSNVEKDPYYAPYCMRCQGLVRMRILERHYWRCSCGASCDYRQAVIDRVGPS